MVNVTGLSPSSTGSATARTVPAGTTYQYAAGLNLSQHVDIAKPPRLEGDHREAFNRLLHAAAQKREQAD